MPDGEHHMEMRDEAGLAAGSAADLVQQVRQGLRAFIAKRVANEAETEDILQEVFLRIHRRLETVTDPRRVVSWVYQITRHAIIDHYRAAGKRLEQPAGLAEELEVMALPTSRGGSAEETGERRAELARCLRPMIEQLSPDYRDAVRLVELEGLTQQEAAARTGLSLSGMKSRVQRGRRQLKRMLEDCCLIQFDARRGVAEFEVRSPESNPCGSDRPCS